MAHNVGSADRAVRVAIGIVLLLAAVFVEGQARWFGLIGAIALLTGLIDNCPLYTSIGIATCRTPKAGR